MQVHLAAAAVYRKVDWIANVRAGLLGGGETSLPLGLLGLQAKACVLAISCSSQSLKPLFDRISNASTT